MNLIIILQDRRIMETLNRWTLRIKDRGLQDKYITDNVDKVFKTGVILTVIRSMLLIWNFITSYNNVHRGITTRDYAILSTTLQSAILVFQVVLLILQKKVFPIGFTPWAIPLWSAVQYLVVHPWMLDQTFSMYSYLFV